MRRFVIGDIHGEHDYLNKVLRLCNFDFDNDLLITLGDIVDRGTDWRRCVDILLKIKNRIDIRGNHDQIFVEYLKTGFNAFRGNYGSGRTIEQWHECDIEEQRIYENFFDGQKNYYVLENKCFVHGGFDREKPISSQVEEVFHWDRTLIMKSLSCVGSQKLKTADGFDEIFIGHTPTLTYGAKGVKPTFSGGVWNIDTGSGKGGVLTIMDIDTKEYWQADLKIFERLSR